MFSSSVNVTVDIAIAAGRAFRFLLEGYFAVRYGAEAKVLLARYYPWIGLALAVGVVLFVVLKKVLRRSPRAEQVIETAVEQTLETGATGRVGSVRLISGN